LYGTRCSIGNAGRFHSGGFSRSDGQEVRKLRAEREGRGLEGTDGGDRRSNRETGRRRMKEMAILFHG